MWAARIEDVGSQDLEQFFLHAVEDTVEHVSGGATDAASQVLQGMGEGP